jgi:phosphoribosylamine--glycine ligase
LLETDLAQILLAVTNAELHDVDIVWSDQVAVSVVMASGGYPGAYKKGIPIEGIDQVGHLSDVVLFHAGTKKDESGKLVTDGGRVLAVTGIGDDFEQARARSYAAVRAVYFDGAHYRTDIAATALESE